MTLAKRLDCAETWSGNRRTAHVIELPGLTVWVHSLPAPSDRAGGDVHYLSLCPSCIVSRIALADVSGHGPSVALVSETLRLLMQRYLSDLEQVGLMRELNQAVREAIGQTHYATMVAVGWHGRRGLAVLTNAGHPPPLWYRASHESWSWLEPRASERGRAAGVPLGLLDDVTYDRLVVKPQPGDLIVLYSDGVSEAMSPAGEELGREGLIDMVRGLDQHSAETLGIELAAAVRAFRGAQEASDDETIIVLKRTGEPGL